MGLPNPENYTTDALVTITRTAMEEGCIRPCHVYDAVDEIMKRLERTEKENAELKAALVSKSKAEGTA